MAKTKLMGTTKVQSETPKVEKAEGPQGASVTVPAAKAVMGKLQRVEIEVADNGGFLVTLYHKEATGKKGMELGYRAPEKHACKTLDDLDEVLDGAFGIRD